MATWGYILIKRVSTFAACTGVTLCVLAFSFLLRTASLYAIKTLHLISLSNDSNLQTYTAPAVKSKVTSHTNPANQPKPKASPKTPASTPPPKADPTTLPTDGYPWHTDIISTIFWVGEAATADNAYIHNRTSAWMTDWVSAFGGVDDPTKRCGYFPCGFMPKENPFYFALPYGEYTPTGLKASAQSIPWYTDALATKGLLLKNRWIEIRTENNAAYAQWEDVGPFYSDDFDYVFKGTQPKSIRAGLDLSPAVAHYLQIGGKGRVQWRFLEAADVPEGPWKQLVNGSPLITASPPKW